MNTQELADQLNTILGGTLGNNAADLLRSQAAEIERLREALEFCAGTSYATDANEAARAALEQK